MRCAACDADNPESARYCASCGAILAATCPHCQASIGLGVRFCTSCGGAIGPSGADIDDALARPEPMALSERRRISILFVDLENFTSLAETLDPEEVRAVQSRYFEVARSVVARFGGTIEKFIGDAVMAVWGAPAAHEDDAERAVRAALEIVDGVGRLGGAASGANLSSRAAVTTGEAAVTVGASGQGMVAGDLVNVAARLQGRAPQGGVLVDAATRDMAPDAADFERVGALSLRGRTGRLRAYRATARAPTSSVVDHGPHTGPFVGRDGDLRELIDLFHAVVRERRSRLVSISGIAGIGKSRLAWELQQQLELLPDDVAWHAGRAPAYGTDITFAAVAGMIRRRIGATDVAPAALARRQLGATLEELVRDEDERRWMEPRVAMLLGGDVAEDFGRDEVFAAWRRFFERVSDRAATVLLFEDLQWADPSLLDFIEHLATWTRDHPILIVGVSRPELLDRHPGWGAGFGRFTALHLERLPDGAMRQLLAGRSPDLPEEVIGRVLERAGGVPLYAVEVARIVADRARRRRSGGGAEPLDVPESLHGLIAARIDALPVPERTLLLAAAVLGRRFGPDALAAVVGGSPSAIRARTESLVRRELLAIDEERASPGRGELVFVQDLVREVAYGTLARTKRRALHLAAARYLEGTEDDRVAESLAGHLLQAHALAPAAVDAERLQRRAVAALRRAAQEAMRLHLPERALTHLERSLGMTVEPHQRAVLLEAAALAARSSARLDVAERHLRELIELRVAAGQAQETSRARAELASVLLMAQRNERALAELRSAIEAFDDIGADAGSVELAAQLARALVLVGDDASGLEWADRALDAAARIGLDPLAADLLTTRGTARYRLGDEAAGIEDLRSAIAAAEEADALRVELRARNNLAWLSVADDPRLTFETAREGYELASAMGVGDVAIQLADVACAAAIDTGDWQWALETAQSLESDSLDEAYRIDLRVNAAILRSLMGMRRMPIGVDPDAPPAGLDPQIVAGARYALAWEAFVDGRHDDARRHALGAATVSLGAERGYELTLAARAALWAGDRDGAAATLGELAGSGLAGSAMDAARSTLAAGLAALDGAPDAADRYRSAAEAWRALDLPLHLCLCLAEEDRFWRSKGTGQGDRIGKADGMAEATAILAELGADGLAARLLAPIRARSAAQSPGRSPRPIARTARPTGEGRQRPTSPVRRRRSG